MLFLAATILFVGLSESNGQDEVCTNTRGQFKYKKEPYFCTDVQANKGLCYKHKRFPFKCPVTCGKCPCEDNQVKFTSVLRGDINCRKVARKKKYHCKDKDVMVNCPFTCDMCYDSVTSAPVPAPAVECSIVAELSFPSPSSIPSTGYHDASLSVVKINEDETCQDGITSWNCLHSGKAAVSKGVEGYNDYSTHEFAHIISGKDGTFVFTASHSQYTDMFVPSNVKILINEEEKARVDHNSIEDISIIVKCDSFCNCVIEDRSSCALRAELNFLEPGSENLEFGYHRDDVEVRKIGSDELCNKDTIGDTSWGCTHGGLAAVWNPENTEYYDYHHSAVVDVPNVFGTTIELDVRHNFNDFELYYEKDHRIQGILSVYINDQLMGEYTHPMNKNADTHLASGMVRTTYKGNYLVTAKCDDSCNCQVVKANY